MMQESSEIVETIPVTGKKNEVTESTTKHNSTWQVLADCQITLPLSRLLKLVPRFTKTVATILTKKMSK